MSISAHVPSVSAENPETTSDATFLEMWWAYVWAEKRICRLCREEDNQPPGSVPVEMSPELADAVDRAETLMARIFEAEPEGMGGVLVQFRVLGKSHIVGSRSDDKGRTLKLARSLERLADVEHDTFLERFLTPSQLAEAEACGA